MITVEKHIKLTIDGDDVQQLKDVLEISRIYIHDHRGEKFAGGGLDERERQKLSAFISDMFDFVR